MNAIKCYRKYVPKYMLPIQLICIPVIAVFFCWFAVNRLPKNNVFTEGVPVVVLYLYVTAITLCDTLQFGGIRRKNNVSIELLKNSKKGKCFLKRVIISETVFRTLIYMLISGIMLIIVDKYGLQINRLNYMCTGMVTMLLMLNIQIFIERSIDSVMAAIGITLTLGGVLGFMVTSLLSMLHWQGIIYVTIFCLGIGIQVLDVISIMKSYERSYKDE